MTFTDTWTNADPDATGGGDPPEDGTHDVVLNDAGAFLSKEKQEPWVKLSFRRLTDDHEWDVIQGFKSQKQANFSKKTCQLIGVDVDAVGDLDELDKALRERCGNYFTVEVKTNGDFVNTYVQEGAPAPDFVPPPVAAAAEPVADDDIPFVYRAVVWEDRYHGWSHFA